MKKLQIPVKWTRVRRERIRADFIVCTRRIATGLHTLEELSATVPNVVELSTVHTSGTGETGNARKCLIVK